MRDTDGGRAASGALRTGGALALRRGGGGVAHGRPGMRRARLIVLREEASAGAVKAARRDVGGDDRDGVAACATGGRG
jgi:hypothetical protein